MISYILVNFFFSKYNLLYRSAELCTEKSLLLIPNIKNKLDLSPLFLLITINVALQRKLKMYRIDILLE